MSVSPDRLNGDDRAEDVELRTFCKTELKTMASIGWPILVSFFCRMGMASEDSAFVGHLGKDPPSGNRLRGFLMERAMSLVGYTCLGMLSSTNEYGPREYLAAAGLSDMVTSILIVPPLAFNQSLNALVGQAMGSNNPKKAGVWLQLSLFWLTVAHIPMLVSFFFVGDILKLLAFPADICELAGQFAKFNVFWPIPNGWYQCLRFYFQAQGITRPAMYNNIFFLGVNALLNWLFVFGGPFAWDGFGFIGAAISLSCSRSLQPLAYWLYMFKWKQAHKPTWPGWNISFLKLEHTKPFMAMSAPQVGTMLLQAVIGQSTTLLVAQLGKLAIDGSAAVQAVIMVCNGGLSAALGAVSGIRTAFHLGAGNAVAAKRTAWLSIAAGILATVAISVILLPLGHVVMTVVTNDPEIQDLGAKLLPASLLNTMASTLVQTGTSGIITSQGRAKLVTFLSMGFELPLSLGSTALVVLAFHSPITLVYWIQAIVSSFEAVVVCLLIRSSNWAKYARDAQKRQGDDENLGTSMVKNDLEDQDGGLVKEERHGA